MPVLTNLTPRTDRRLLAGFVLAVGGLIAVGIFVQKALQETQTTTNLRAEARKTAFQIKILKALLTDAETGQRGYLLTGDDRYLHPYYSAVRDIPRAYVDLETRLSDDPQQLLRLRRAETLIEKKLGELSQTVEYKKSRHEAQALKMMREGRGQTYMEELRQLFLDLEESQIQEVAAHHARVERIVKRSARVVFLGSSVAVVLVSLLIYLLMRNQQRRAIVEDSLRDTNQALEHQRNLLSRIISTQNKIATAALDSQTVMELVVKLSRDLTKSDGATIEILEGDMLVYRHVGGAAVPYQNFKIPVEGSFAGLCLKEGRPLICLDSEVDERVNREACRKVNLRSMIVAPLQFRGKNIGILKNYSALPHAYDEATFNALALITGLLSSSLGQAKDFEDKVSAIVDLEKAKLELIQSRDLAQSAAETKARFLANMSHEIRTPLNGILGMTGLLLDGKLENEQQEYANAIKTSGQVLLQLVNDVLDFSKMEGGHLQFESLNFGMESTVQDTLKSFQFVAKQKSLKLGLDIDPRLPSFLCGDPGRIRQILTNLIGNAIKFTQRGSVHTKVSVVEDKPDGVLLRFDIQDTGIGIDPEVTKSLFREFVQADASTTRRFGGTGLGLSICKGLVERMGGQIGVTSEAGQGSCFWFTVKLQHARNIEKTASAATLEKIPERDRPWRILIGEDNRFNQIIVVKMLEKLGLRADVAANGKEVVEALQSRPYDLVFMDCHMPEMDGYEATAFIRQSPTISKHDIPIIAMTANAMKGDREKTLAAGMDDYISKPLDINKLKELLLKWTQQLDEKLKKTA